MTIAIITPQRNLATNTATCKLNKPHIVVVEDDCMVAEALQILLQPRFKLKVFTRAMEALSYIRKTWQAIDLIVLDYQLPDMNGLELLRILKQDSLPKHLPTILQSANSRDILTHAVVKPDFYLEKPWTKHQMMNAINNILFECIAINNKATELQSK